MSSGDIDLGSMTYATGTIHCPAGAYVTGTGFNLRGMISFVLSYDTFVGYFLDNELGITTTVSAQAICGSATSASVMSLGANAVSSDLGSPTSVQISKDAWSSKLSQLEHDAAAAGLHRMP